MSQTESPTNGRRNEPYGWLEPVEPRAYLYREWRPPVRRRTVWQRYGINVLLLVLTVLSVHDVGGWRLVAGLMSILFAHEMGHYVACVLYRVDATLPYFIPLPLPGFTLVGTLGAFIKIRSPIPNRRALFDIGIAGPLAGFVVSLPVLALGVLEAQTVPARHELGSISLGEPLLFKAAVDQGLTLVGLWREGQNLEQIFRELTTSDDGAGKRDQSSSIGASAS